MKNTNRYKVLAVAIASVIILAFIVVRSSFLDQSYRTFLTERSGRIVNAFNSFFTRNEFSQDTISSYLKETTSRYADLALIAVSGEDKRVILLSKNNNILSDPKTYDECADDIYGGRIPVETPPVITAKYYNNTKFYIIPVTGQKGVLTLVYPRRLPASFILRFLLEIIAVSCVASALCGILYLSLLSRRSKTPAKKSSSAEKKPAPAKKEKITTIDAFLFKSFNEIAAQTDADMVSLAALHEKTGKVEKYYILKNGAFVKTKSSKELAPDSRKEIITELSHGSYIMRDRSRRVLIPVVINDALRAMITVSRQKKITGNEVAAIKKQLSGIESFF